MTQATLLDWKPHLDWAYHLFKTNAVLSSLTITSLVRDRAVVVVQGPCPMVVVRQ
jgi:hypothetical protein